MALEGGRTLRIASSARGGATWLGRRLCWPLSHRPVSGGASQVGLPARVPGAGLGLGYGMGLQPPRRRVAERLPGRAMAWGRRAVDRSRVTAVARWRRMFCARRSHSRGGWVGAIEWRPGLCAVAARWGWPCEHTAILCVRAAHASGTCERHDVGCWCSWPRCGRGRACLAVELGTAVCVRRIAWKGTCPSTNPPTNHLSYLSRWISGLRSGRRV